MKHNSREDLYAKLNQKSSSELLDILEGMLDKENFDADVAIVASDILDGRNPINPGYDAVASYAEFVASNSELFETTAEKPARAKTLLFRRMPRSLRVASMVLVILLSMFGLFSGSVVLASRLGAPLSVEWGGRTYTFTPWGVVEEHNEQAESFRAMEEATRKAGIKEDILFKRYPEVFSFAEVTVSEMEDFTYIVGTYTSASHDRMFFMRITFQPPWRSFAQHPEDGADGSDEESDSSDGVAAAAASTETLGEEYIAGGIVHLLSENMNQVIATWENGSCACNISGDLSMDELKDIINSIYD